MISIVGRLYQTLISLNRRFTETPYKSIFKTANQMNVLFREEWSALRRASRQEVNGSPHINAIEASEAITH